MASDPSVEAQLERQFETLAAAWLFTHRSWNTRSAYEADLSQFAFWCAESGHTPLQADRDDVVRYRNECMAEGASPATVSRRLAALTSFYDHAVTANDGSANPADGVTRPDLARTTSTNELDVVETRALLDAAQRSDAKVAALVGLLLLDGLKLSEALAANIDDLTDDPPELRLPGRGRRQSVPLSPATTNALQRCAGERTRGPLLVSHSRAKGENTRLTRFGADYLLKKVAARAGITKPVSANTLRRRYVTSAHSTGRSLEEIQASVGHSDRRTTRRLLSAPAEPQPSERSTSDADPIRPVP